MNPFDLRNVADLSGLTDDDWIELNRLAGIREQHGQEAFETALRELLVSEPIRALTILEAVAPRDFRQAAAKFEIPDKDMVNYLRSFDKPVRNQ